MENYEKALELLYHVDFTDASYYIGAKIIQLKSYYALGELEASLSLIATFRSFVQRSKVLSEHKKQMNHNMLKMAKKIINLEAKKITLSNTKLLEKKAELGTEINSLSPIANSDWLLEILAEM